MSTSSIIIIIIYLFIYLFIFCISAYPWRQKEKFCFLKIIPIFVHTVKDSNKDANASKVPIGFLCQLALLAPYLFCRSSPLWRHKTGHFHNQLLYKHRSVWNDNRAINLTSFINFIISQQWNAPSTCACLQRKQRISKGNSSLKLAR